MASAVSGSVATELSRLTKLEGTSLIKGVKGVGGSSSSDSSPSSTNPGSDVLAATEKVKDFVQIVRRNLEFSVDEQTGRTVITVVDADSGNVVRQIPPEDILAAARNLDELSGVLFRGRA
ncbi:MAG TPA: flagellar protein FlaG [Gammaproteobacteria bacterium]|nr:flagellar protein FlaG [Gammaproteobacteria bacterium]